MTIATTDTSQETVLLLSRSPGAQVTAALVVDASLEETHSSHATITDHPVEQGENVVDHVRPEPDQLVATCVVSNTPVDTGERAANVSQNGYVFQSVTPSGADDSRGRQFWKGLLNEKNNGSLFTVATRLRRYTSMAIESLSAVQNSKNSDGVEFQITFKHIVVVQNQLTTARKSKDTRNSKKVKKGTSAPSDEPPTSTAWKAMDKSSSVMQGVSNGTISGVGDSIQGFLTAP